MMTLGDVQKTDRVRSRSPVPVDRGGPTGHRTGPVFFEGGPTGHRTGPVFFLEKTNPVRPLTYDNDLQLCVLNPGKCEEHHELPSFFKFLVNIV